jgi:spore coat protein CotH
LTELKHEAAHLPSKDRRELIAFLVALQTQTDEGFKEKLAAKIDDRDPTRWLELNEVKRRWED